MPVCSCLGDCCCASLPPGWEAKISRTTGDTYYVFTDENGETSASSQFNFPRRLKKGWRAQVSRSTGDIYYVDANGRSVYDHPGHSGCGIGSWFRKFGCCAPPVSEGRRNSSAPAPAPAAAPAHEPAEQEPLRAGWETKTSTTTGETYYFNVETGESTFEHPGFVGDELPVQGIPAVAVPPPPTQSESDFPTGRPWLAAGRLWVRVHRCSNLRMEKGPPSARVELSLCANNCSSRRRRSRHLYVALTDFCAGTSGIRSSTGSKTPRASKRKWRRARKSAPPTRSLASVSASI